MDIIAEKWRNRWSSDEVRVLVLASLGLQIGLIFLAPLRKRNKNPVLMLTLWLLYLTADNVAILALGNISNQADPAESCDSGTKPSELTILWAPFLLLHLGGPDSITSYSVEDNELWWRHLLGLVVQVVITVYVFWQSPPLQWLWIPTILVFLPGLIKFAERTHALRLGSKDNLKDKIISEISPAFDTKKVEILSKSIKNGKEESEREIKDNQLPANEAKSISEHSAGPANESKAELRERESQDICEGYVWFDIFKRLLVDVTFPSNLLMQSQDRFSGLSAGEALNLVSIELSFLYDILHTKAVHMHYNFGRVWRCSSLVCIVAALIVFHYLDMQKYASKDIIITYILFGAGLTLEVVAALLLVSSDWTVVSLRKKEWRKCIAHAITKIVKRITLMKGKSRWSKTIGQYNLVGYCLRDKDTLLEKIMRKLKIKRIWDNMRESRSICLSESLEEIMFIEAKRRAQNVHIYNVLVEARSYRGSKALERHGQLKTLEWSMKREFDECIILWHVATDICYYKEFTPKQTNMNGSDDTNDTKRDVSWRTSNYMVYLLTQQQSMMQLGYGKTRFEATCAVVKKKFKNFKGNGKLDHKKAHAVLEQKEVAAPVLEQNEVAAPGLEQNEVAAPALEQNEVAAPALEQNEVAAPALEQNDPPVSDDGHQPTNKMVTLVLKEKWANWRFWGNRKGEEDKRKGEDEMGELVLQEGLRLAKLLQTEVDQQIRWKLISETWMEMLGYAAIHCNSYQHAKSLSRGGELLTHLWLLMAQLGVAEEHRIQQFQSGSV